MIFMESRNTDKAQAYKDFIKQGNDAFDKEKYQLAISYYQKAIEIHPTYYFAYACIAKALEADGYLSKAMALYTEASEAVYNITFHKNRMPSLKKNFMVKPTM